jgi:hypothetical protein
VCLCAVNVLAVYTEWVYYSTSLNISPQGMDMTLDETILSIRDKYKSDIEGLLSVYMKLAILEGYQAGKRDCNQAWLDNLRNAEFDETTERR